MLLSIRDNLVLKHYTEAKLAIDDFYHIPSLNYVQFIKKISKCSYKETVTIMGLGPCTIMLQMKSADTKNKYKPLYLIYKNNLPDFYSIIMLEEE